MWKLVGFIFSFSIVPFFMGWFWHEKRNKIGYELRIF